jgi:glycosyltransferase involved in cell wall biosynthesis
MRIALVTDGIWPYVLGGMQKHSYYICKFLAARKVHVDVYHFNQSNYDISKAEFFSEEEKKYLRFFIVPFPRSLPFPGHYIYNSYRHSVRVYESIRPRLKEYDFIYSKGFTGWKLLNEKTAKRISCAPVGVKFHGYEMFQWAPDVKTRLQHFLLLRAPVRKITRMADIVFSYGGKITQLIGKLGVRNDKIIELPSGVEKDMIVSHAREAGSPIKFLFLGRYERRKGIEEYNQCLQRIGNVHAEFHFIGPIPEEKKVKRPSVFYHGEIRDRAKLFSLMADNDVLVCPSWSEGLPNVILEAMGRGLAVIATDVGAVSAVVNDSNGWLLDNPSAAALEETILNIISSGAATVNLKKERALRTVADGFTWEVLVDKLISEINRVAIK